MSDIASLAAADRTRLAGSGELLPLLPLPWMVLLPGEELELHVFAPRYCALVREVLGQGGRLVVSAIRREELADPPEHPAVEPIACCARIVRAEALPDGTFIVVLGGLERVQLHGEGGREAGFRWVRATVEPSEEGAGLDGAGMLSRELVAALPMLLDDDPEERREVADLLPAADTDGLIALTARALELDCTAKQGLLETRSRAERCLSVGMVLAERVLAYGGAEPLVN